MEIVDPLDDKENSSTYIDSCKPLTSLSLRPKSTGREFLEIKKHDSVNGLLSTELNLNRENKKQKKKIKKIKSVIMKKPFDLNKLRKLAISEEGLVNDEIRKIAWLYLLDVKDTEVPKFANEKDIESHSEYQQVVLDVNRCIERFPPGISLEQRLVLQNELVQLILKVITVHPNLRYYQGYHDVAITLLLVTGLDAAYVILEKLSTKHLKECMEPTMEKTCHLLNYIYPLVKYQNEELFSYLEKSGVGTIFALPWFLTWFGHNINQYPIVVRLFDYFLASEPLAPLYLAAVIIAFRSKEILSTPCDMANLHSLLSQLPNNLPFEDLIVSTTLLYQNHPPAKIEKEASERTQREKEQRKKELAIRKYKGNQNLSFIWRILQQFHHDHRLPVWTFGYFNHLDFNFSRYTYFVATASFAVGLYAAYLKTYK